MAAATYEPTPSTRPTKYNAQKYLTVPTFKVVKVGFSYKFEKATKAVTTLDSCAFGLPCSVKF